MRIRWIDKKGQHPRVMGYIEEVKDRLALLWIARGICEEVKEPKKRKAAVVPEPPKTTAEASPVQPKGRGIQFPVGRRRKG